MDDTLKARLKRRETWAYLTGCFIGLFSVIAPVAMRAAGIQDESTFDVEFTALAVGLATAFLGTGATAQIKRGQQRGEEAARVAHDAISAVVRGDATQPPSVQVAITPQPAPPAGSAPVAAAPAPALTAPADDDRIGP